MTNSRTNTFNFTIENNPLLASEQEAAATPEQLILANIRLVLLIAPHYCNRGLDYDDIVSEGMLGLITAANKFVSNSKNRFSTYAAIWIRSTIRRAIDTKAHIIYVPKEWSQRSSKQVPHVAISLDDTFSNGDNKGSYYDFIADDSSLTGEEEVCRKEERENIRTALSQLSKREYDILCRSAGVEYDKVQSLSEIGRAYGISKERVRQIRENAVLKMKRLLSNVA